MSSTEDQTKCPHNEKCSSDDECLGACYTELKCLRVGASGKFRCVEDGSRGHPHCINCSFTPGSSKNSTPTGRRKKSKKSVRNIISKLLPAQ